MPSPAGLLGLVLVGNAQHEHDRLPVCSCFDLDQLRMQPTLAFAKRGPRTDMVLSARVELQLKPSVVVGFVADSVPITFDDFAADGRLRNRAAVRPANEHFD